MWHLRDLLDVLDAYARAAGGLPDTTVSYRVFGDSKKLGQLRTGAQDITLGRANSAFLWLAQNWPADAARPDALDQVAARLADVGA